MTSPHLLPCSDPTVGPGRVLTFAISPRGELTVLAATQVLQDRTGHLMAAVVGPGPTDDAAMFGWLERDCPDPCPQRQGFVAVLTRSDGTSTIAVSARKEVSLYYRIDERGLLASSSVKALVSRLPEPPTIDLQKLTDLSYDHDDPRSTWFHGVERLPPGHMAQFKWNRVLKVRRWFAPPLYPDGERPRETAAELMRYAVRDAVQASLPPNGDVAASLSGGLDSTMVAATAASILLPQGRRVHGYTHVPRPGTISQRDGWLPSDEPAVRQLVAATSGLDYEAVMCDPTRTPFDALLDQFPDTLAPHRNIPNTDWLLQIRRRVDHAGYGVTFGGQSGNLGFSWNGATSVSEMVRNGYPTQAWRLARQSNTRTRATKFVVAARFPALSQRLIDRRHPVDRSAWQWHDGLLNAASESALAAWEEAVRGRSLATRARWYSHLLSSVSVQSVAQPPASVSWRSDPLSDPEVVRLAIAIHPAAWINGGVSRVVAREAMRGLVPDEIRLRRERGMQGADDYMRLGNRRDAYRRAVEMVEASPTATEFVDASMLRRSLDGLPEGDQNAYTMWTYGPGRVLGFALFAAWWDENRRRKTFLGCANPVDKGVSP